MLAQVQEERQIIFLMREGLKNGEAFENSPTKQATIFQEFIEFSSPCLWLGLDKAVSDCD